MIQNEPYNALPYNDASGLYYVTIQKGTLQQTVFSFLVLALILVNSAMSQTKTEQAAADSRQRIAGPVTMAMLGPGLYFPLPLPDTQLTQLCRQLRPESGEKPGPCPLLHSEPLATGHLLHWGGGGYFLLDWLMLLGIRLINIWHHTMSPQALLQENSLSHSLNLNWFLVILTLWFCNLSKTSLQYVDKIVKNVFQRSQLQHLSLEHILQVLPSYSHRSPASLCICIYPVHCTRAEPQCPMSHLFPNTTAPHELHGTP